LDNIPSGAFRLHEGIINPLKDYHNRARDLVHWKSACLVRPWVQSQHCKEKEKAENNNSVLLRERRTF
jgi:hypothetical protein